MLEFKAWPEMCFDKGFDLARPPAKTFLALVDQRNALTHVTTITAYQSLGPPDAANAVRVAEEIVGEFFRPQKAGAVEVLKQIHLLDL